MTLYNPHVLPRQELIETFVARQPLLDELLDDLRRGGAQHHLLVGGRGTGKTTLLLRLAAAIEDDKQLAKKCIPLRFPEEQYNVSRPSDFWMNAIDALIDALEHHGDRVVTKQLEARLSELESLDEDVRATQALAVLESWARQARRVVVLLVDNLDLVLDRLAASHWELREALSSDNRLAVIGGSSTFLDEAIDYQSPFYEFFRVHELGPLTEDEARRVVLSLARRANTPQVAEVLERDPGRFQALYALTGGTPRSLALLHTVLALGPGDRIERDLDGMLDQLTPYYKARFDDLAPQSQVIVDAVALHWHPITAAQCEAATRLEVNTVSAQLNRLVKRGLLTKVPLPEPGKLGFQVSERFFNIWYLMRASRRLRRRLSWFVEFLRIFYGEEDLRRRAEELVRAAPAVSLNSPAKFLAFASAVPDEALRRRLELRAIELLMNEGLSVVQEAMDLGGEDVHMAPVVDRVRALRDLRVGIARAKIKWPAGQTSASVAERIARSPLLSLEDKQALANLDGPLVAQNIEGFLSKSDVASAKLGERLLNAISSGEVPSFGDVRTSAEMQQIVELAESRWFSIGLLLTVAEFHERGFSDEIIQQLLILDPRAADGALATAAVLVRRRNWTRARHLALLAARQGSAALQLATWIHFLRDCISQNLSTEALELLIEVKLAERWTPLYEALRATAERNRGRLDGLAPEVRAPAVSLYEQLHRAEPAQGGGTEEPGGKARSKDHTAPTRRASPVPTAPGRKQDRQRRPTRRKQPRESVSQNDLPSLAPRRR